MPLGSFSLNDRAAVLAERLASEPRRYNVTVDQLPGGARFVDCGIQAKGGLETGRLLAEICLAGLGSVTIAPARSDLWAGPTIEVRSDQPVAACLASQYAGWQLAAEKYFAMGSGPMRAAANREPIFADLQYIESPQQVVGVLETSKTPPSAIVEQIAAACHVSPDRVTLLGARTASIAGTVQVVARSVETALHKLHALKFDLQQVVSGYGTAPLPPIAKSDLTAIGWTNDAVLYGGDVTLWVHADDDQLAELGPQVPSNSSSDFGEPFASIFQRYNGDFYKIDPLLFSPGTITFINLASGKLHRFGTLRPDVLQHWLLQK
ncbi:methenyltetrahydromethanopterin cyclohydrolase [Anatilimnocola sp. NA78]|uniref:methenyltetrahydromethanopterin cyclohydrolase n=1 Tax=Anatilimnocola sp. NA78 TaxID=3415683 RepID=UPI003CE4E262